MKPPIKAAARLLTGPDARYLKAPEGNSLNGSAQPCARDLLREPKNLRVMQAPIERAFWNLEKRIASLVDEIERRAS
jgi:hypothetical protein